MNLQARFRAPSILYPVGKLTADEPHDEQALAQADEACQHGARTTRQASIKSTKDAQTLQRNSRKRSSMWSEGSYKTYETLSEDGTETVLAPKNPNKACEPNKPECPEYAVPSKCLNKSTKHERNRSKTHPIAPKHFACGFGIQNSNTCNHRPSGLAGGLLQSQTSGATPTPKLPAGRSTD